MTRFWLYYAECILIVVQFSVTGKQPHKYGGVAQLGEHLPCKQGVMGSNPIISTRSAVPTADSKGSTSKGERGNTEPVNHKGA